MSILDLDKSGHGYQKVRTYLGPSLGWTEEYVQPMTEIKTSGLYEVKPGDSIILVNVPSVVQIQLPDVRLWVHQKANQPATAFDRSLTIKDLGGNATNFNIVISPFGQQAIDSIQGAVVLGVSRAVIKLIPLNDLSGWISEVASVTPGGGGGGDVFKAGNNAFTGTNTFLGETTVVTVPDADDSTKVASTEWVNNQDFVTSVSLLPYALLASPSFEGTPKAPTPDPDADDATIVTVGFVEAALAGFSGGAPVDAEYILGAVTPALPAHRIFENTATVSWDLSIPGKVKANTAAGGGNVSNSGSPTAGQIAEWVTPTTIKGTSLSALGFQPLDGDLTAISALNGTNTIYYRSAPDIWSPVTFSGLTFSGGVLTATGGGTVNISGTPLIGQMARWTNATTIEGVLAPPKFTAVGSAPSSPVQGDFWYDLSTGILSIFIDDGNTSQWVQVSPPLVGAGTGGSGGGSFEAGTLMLFQQPTAPTGWVKQVTHNDKALRVVSGVTTNGGFNTFSSTFGKTATDSHTLSTAQMPSHGHVVTDNGHTHSVYSDVNGPQFLSFNDSATDVFDGGGATYAFSARTAVALNSTTGISIQGAGGGQGHSHAMDLRVQFVDVIIASKT